MKVVILAGGLGTRLSEETDIRPKPMVNVGDKPILWHIMKTYAHHGHKDFVICLGYKGYVIKEYFANYYLHTRDITVNTKTGDMKVHSEHGDDWNVTLVETGINTMTGGRLKRVREYLGNEDFFMTYGDGVSNVDINALLAYHKQEGRQATVTAVRPSGRFGALELNGTRVERFAEKPRGDGSFINGGFFVLSPKVIDLIAGDDTTWEREPMETLAASGQLTAYHHDGFWQPMDTLRDKNHLDSLWASGQAEWKVW